MWCANASWLFVKYINQTLNLKLSLSIKVSDIWWACYLLNLSCFKLVYWYTCNKKQQIQYHPSWKFRYILLFLFYKKNPPPQKLGTWQKHGRWKMKNKLFFSTKLFFFFFQTKISTSLKSTLLEICKFVVVLIFF